jgi:ribokinase
VMQLESPMETVSHAARIAHEAGVRVVLTPAPARVVPRETLAQVDVLIPNEYEAAQLAALDTSDDEELGRALLDAGVKTVIITLGSKGALLVQKSGTQRFAAKKVEAVDTTAAGDSFTGALACALSEGRDIAEAVNFAIAAAAISVTRMGAQPSLPTRSEVEGS